MIRTSLTALAFAALAASAASAQAAEATPDQVVAHHIQAASAKDVEAAVSDYADDAVVLTPTSTVQGKAAIRSLFQGMWSGPGGAFDSKQLAAVGDVGSTQWVMNPGKPGSVTGKDVFIVRHGKIMVQTVFIGGPPAQP